jgi:hypothetical protein
LRPDIYGKIGNSGVSICCLDDAKKLDLDLLYKIGDNAVVIEVEKYGVEEQVFDYHLTSKQIEQLGYQPELDFFVENKTGKTKTRYIG